MEAPLVKAYQGTELSSAIVKTCLYFGFFSFPLRKKEIYANLSFSCTFDAFSLEFDQLIGLRGIHEIDGYYGLKITQKDVSDRKADEARCKQAEAKMRKSARIIAKFPFVKGVGISGSISKGVMKENGDVDFFIITQHNRLWVCRTFLVLYKKVFRLNSRKYFCVNYFVGEKHLAIPDHNVFTATELSHLIPVYGKDVLDDLKHKNQWCREFLPNYSREDTMAMVDSKYSWFKWLGEKVLGGRLGSSFDKWARKQTLKRWKRKFTHFTDDNFELALRSDRNVSKHHPSNFQVQLLEHLDQEAIKFQEETGIKIV